MSGPRRIISQIYHKPVTCAQDKTDVNEMHAVFVIVVLLLLAISSEPDLGTATENDSFEDENMSSKTRLVQHPKERLHAFREECATSDICIVTDGDITNKKLYKTLIT